MAQSLVSPGSGPCGSDSYSSFAGVTAMKAAVGHLCPSFLYSTKVKGEFVRGSWMCPSGGVGIPAVSWLTCSWLVDVHLGWRGRRGSTGRRVAHGSQVPLVRLHSFSFSQHSPSRCCMLLPGAFLVEVLESVPKVLSFLVPRLRPLSASGVERKPRVKVTSVTSEGLQVS